MPKRSVEQPVRIVGGGVPWTPDPADPRTSTEDMSASLQQVVVTSLLDCSNTHPWLQGLGIADGTFGGTDGAGDLRLRVSITDRFDVLSGRRRARLQALQVRSEDNRRVAEVVYRDLEVNRVIEEEVDLG